MVAGRGRCGTAARCPRRGPVLRSSGGGARAARGRPWVRRCPRRVSVGRFSTSTGDGSWPGRGSTAAGWRLPGPASAPPAARPVRATGCGLLIGAVGLRRWPLPGTASARWARRPPSRSSVVVRRARRRRGAGRRWRPPCRAGKPRSRTCPAPQIDRRRSGRGRRLLRRPRRHRGGGHGVRTPTASVGRPPRRLERSAHRSRGDAAAATSAAPCRCRQPPRRARPRRAATVPHPRHRPLAPRRPTSAAFAGSRRRPLTPAGASLPAEPLFRGLRPVRRWLSEDRGPGRRRPPGGRARPACGSCRSRDGDSPVAVRTARLRSRRPRRCAQRPAAWRSRPGSSGAPPSSACLPCAPRGPRYGSPHPSR